MFLNLNTAGNLFSCQLKSFIGCDLKLMLSQFTSNVHVPMIAIFVLVYSIIQIYSFILMIAYGNQQCTMLGSYHSHNRFAMTNAFIMR